MSGFEHTLMLTVVVGLCRRRRRRRRLLLLLLPLLIIHLGAHRRRRCSRSRSRGGALGGPKLDDLGVLRLMDRGRDMSFRFSEICASWRFRAIYRARGQDGPQEMERN